MDNGIILEIAKDNPDMTDIDRLVNIYHLLSQVLVFEVPGDIVEVGCNAGKTSVFLQMIIDFYDLNRTLHVYDSFKGLPKPSHNDNYLKEGECRATPEDLLQVFSKWEKRPPIIHEGWFEDTLPTTLPSKIAFAYLDSDFYESIIISLEYVYNRLPHNGILLVDDYCDLERNPQAWPELPGVKKACDTFLADKPEKISVLVGTGDLSFGYFRKL